MSDLLETLKRGRDAAQRLAPARDELTETIARIERTLVETEMGVTAQVSLSDHNTDGIQGYLGFNKLGKTWRLLISTCNSEDGIVSNPLVNESIEVKMQAVERLPILIERLVTTSVAETARVEAKRAKAAGILEGLTRNAESSTTTKITVRLSRVDLLRHNNLPDTLQDEAVLAALMRVYPRKIDAPEKTPMHSCPDCGRHHHDCPECGTTMGDTHSEACPWNGMSLQTTTARKIVGINVARQR